MENFEKNREKSISPEGFEKNIELKEILSNPEEEVEINSLEKGERTTGSGASNSKENKPSKSNKVSPIINKKMQYFLDIAEEKGLAAAIKAVEKENDPLLLDSFHDALAKEKLFEEILKKKK
ncbi:MAG: hypothetical protein WC470_00435 [Candidatus Paceibacterota bacterium]